MTIGPSPGEDVALSVDVVVPAFNGWELTRGSLESLRRQTLAHAVVVADNASTDGTPDRVRESFPEAGVVELTRTRGSPSPATMGREPVPATSSSSSTTTSSARRNSSRASSRRSRPPTGSGRSQPCWSGPTRGDRQRRSHRRPHLRGLSPASRLLARRRVGVRAGALRPGGSGGGIPAGRVGRGRRSRRGSLHVRGGRRPRVTAQDGRVGDRLAPDAVAVHVGSATSLIALPGSAITAASRAATSSAATASSRRLSRPRARNRDRRRRGGRGALARPGGIRGRVAGWRSAAGSRVPPRPPMQATPRSPSAKASDSGGGSTRRELTRAAGGGRAGVRRELGQTHLCAERSPPRKSRRRAGPMRRNCGPGLHSRSPRPRSSSVLPTAYGP